MAVPQGSQAGDDQLQYSLILMEVPNQ